MGQNAVLKMDIEGVEHIICRDERFVRFLSRFKLVVLEVHDRDHFSIEGFMLDVVYKLEQGNWNSYIVKKSTNFSVILLTQAVANSEV